MDHCPKLKFKVSGHSSVFVESVSSTVLTLFFPPDDFFVCCLLCLVAPGRLPPVVISLFNVAHFHTIMTFHIHEVALPNKVANFFTMIANISR